jgi:hypothetical protein
MEPILMKRKNRNKAVAVPPRRKSWLRRLFVKKPKPLMSRKRLREAKLMAAAARRAFLTLAIGAAVVAALFAIVLSVPPQISPEQLAADVKAMRVHEKTPGLSTKWTEPSSVVGSARSTYAHDIPAEPKDNAAATTMASAPYPLVNFEMLSGFRFFVTDQMVAKPSDSVPASQKCLSQIPEEVRTLNDKNVSLSGFMLPMRYEGKLATEFLLLRNQSLCCYGRAPKITEWVNVRMVGKGVKPIMDEPVTVWGVFHVGDVRENGELVGIYGLDAQKVKSPRE